MAATIEAVWADFRVRLRPRTTIKAWGIARGYTGMQFSIVDVDGAAITISPSTGNERRLFKGEFERLLSYWEPYKSGRITRAELTEKSQNTTYVLSLLHWREV